MEDPALLAEKQRIFAQRVQEADKARQEIDRRFPKTDLLRKSDPPRSRASTAKQSVNPHTVAEQSLEKSGPSVTCIRLSKTTNHVAITGTVSFPIGVYSGKYVLQAASGKPARPVPHGKGVDLF